MTIGEVTVDEAPLLKKFSSKLQRFFFLFQTWRSETSVSYQWADKFSEPGRVLVPRKPRLKIQFLSATATTLNCETLLFLRDMVWR